MWSGPRGTGVDQSQRCARPAEGGRERDPKPETLSREKRLPIQRSRCVGDVERCIPKEGCVRYNLPPNVKEHATLSAGASVDHGVEVEGRKGHENRAADRGCVSRLVRCWLVCSRMAASIVRPTKGSLHHFSWPVLHPPPLLVDRKADLLEPLHHP